MQLYVLGVQLNSDYLCSQVTFGNRDSPCVAGVGVNKHKHPVKEVTNSNNIINRPPSSTPPLLVSIQS